MARIALLRPIASLESVWIFSSFTGTSGSVSPVRVISFASLDTVKGICLLHRGMENVIHPADAETLRQPLFQQLHIPGEPVLAEKAFSLYDKLLQIVPLWEMICNKDPEAAKVAYWAMCPDQE